MLRLILTTPVYCLLTQPMFTSVTRYEWCENACMVYVICIQEKFTIKFTGRAWNSPLYIRGGDEVGPKIESLAAVPIRNDGMSNFKLPSYVAICGVVVFFVETPEPLKAVIVTFTHFKTQPEKSTLTRTLEICSIKSSLLKKVTSQLYSIHIASYMCSYAQTTPAFMFTTHVHRHTNPQLYIQLHIKLRCTYMHTRARAHTHKHTRTQVISCIHIAITQLAIDFAILYSAMVISPLNLYPVVWLNCLPLILPR